MTQFAILLSQLNCLHRKRLANFMTSGHRIEAAVLLQAYFSSFQKYLAFTLAFRFIYLFHLCAITLCAGCKFG